MDGVVLSPLQCPKPSCPCRRPLASSAWLVHCPLHDDRNPSLGLRVEGGKVLAKCYAGCPQQDLWARLQEVGAVPSPGKPAGGLTLAQLADYLSLPSDFLTSLGLSDATYGGSPAVRWPYRDAEGNAVAYRFRISLSGDRFRWAKGANPVPYGLWRLPDPSEDDEVLLVEGESDCWVLWYAGLTALGLPGAGVWKEEWADFLEGRRVYLWQEPDPAGRDLAERVCRSLGRLYVVRAPEGAKDPLDLWRQVGADRDAFRREMVRLLLTAQERRAVSVPQEVADHYHLEREAVYLRRPSGLVKVLGKGIQVLRRLETGDGESALEVEWHFLGRSVRSIVPAQVLTRQANQVAHYLTTAWRVPVLPEEVHHLRRILGAYLTDPNVPTGPYCPRPGWYRDPKGRPEFRLGWDDIPEDGLPPSLSAYGQASPVGEGEALDAWRSLIRWARVACPQVLPLLGASVASLFLGLRQGGTPVANLHLFSPQTGVGKTTMLRLASAIWGPPDLLVETWHATPNYLEAYLSELGCLPAFLDEAGFLDRGKADLVVLLVHEGEGKGRASLDGRMRRRRAFRSVVLSTGNGPLLQEGLGQRKPHLLRRVLEVPLWSPPPAPLVEEMRRLADGAFGHPIRAVLAQVRSWEADRFLPWLLPDPPYDLQPIYDDLGLQSLRSQAVAWAYVLEGLMVLLEALGFDEEEMGQAEEAFREVVRQSLRYIAGEDEMEGDTIDYPTLLLRTILDDYDANPETWEGQRRHPLQACKGRLLDWEAVGNATFPRRIAVLPWALKALAERAGLPDLRTVLRECAERGLLDRTEPHMSRPVRMEGRLVRAYIFRLPDGLVKSLKDDTAE